MDKISPKSPPARRLHRDYPAASSFPSISIPGHPGKGQISKKNPRFPAGMSRTGGKNKAGVWDRDTGNLVGAREEDSPEGQIRGQILQL